MALSLQETLDNEDFQGLPPIEQKKVLGDFEGFNDLPPEEQDRVLVRPTVTPALAPVQLPEVTPEPQTEPGVLFPTTTRSTQPFLGTPFEEFNAFNKVLIEGARGIGEAIEAVGPAVRDIISGEEIGTGTTSADIVKNLTGRDPTEESPFDLMSAIEFATNPLLGAARRPAKSLEFGIERLTADAPFFVPLAATARLVGSGVRALKGTAKKLAPPEAVVKEAPGLLPSLAPEGVVFSKGLTKADKGAIRSSVKAGDLKPTDKVVPGEGLQGPKVVNSSMDDIVEQATKDSNKGKAKLHYDEPMLDDVVKLEKEIGPTQVARDAISTIEATGPIGNAAGRFLRALEQKWERFTSQNVVDLENVLTREFGLRVGPTITKRLNPLRTKGVQKQWRVTEAENEALVNYLYTGGDVKWLAALKPAAQQKVKNVADEFFRITKSINEQKGIGMLPGRHNPDGSITPFGRPNMFFMQQPESAALIAKQSEVSLKRFLQAARKDQNNPSLTLAQFKKQMNSQHHRYGEVSEHTQFVRGLEDARTFDASVGNTQSAFKNLRDTGYGVDPLRALARYAINVNKKADLVENAELLAKMQTDLLGVLPRNKTYVNRLFEEFKGTSVELADEFATNFMSKVRSFNAATLLQFATANNMNQFTFIAQKGGIFRTMHAALSLPITSGGKGMTIPLAGGKQIDDVAKRSGALFNIYMQELSAPRHMWSRWAQTVLHVNGFTAAEKWMRYTAANVGGMHITLLTKQAMKHANNPKRFDLIRRQMLEFGVDANAVVARGGLTEAEALGAVQRFANETTGRRTLSGVPLFVTNHGQMSRTFLQFKEFMFTNVAEMSRVAVNSPSPFIAAKRLTRGAAASLVIGEMTRDLSFFLTGGGSIMPTSEERVPKALIKAVGNATAARAIDNIIAGYANIAMVLAATAIQGQSFSDLVVGPTFGFINDVFTKGPVKTITRRIVGPRRAPEDITDPFAGGGDFGGEEFGGF